MTTMTSVTVRVPLTIRRRGGRKMIISPDGVAMTAGRGTLADIAVTRGDPALVKALARAFRWKRMLDNGHHASIRELAKAENVNRAYVARLLNLTLLAPVLVEAVLDGHQPEGLTLSAVVEDVPPIWADQTAAWSGRSGDSADPARQTT